MSDQPEDLERTRDNDELKVLRALRDAAQQAHRDRTRNTTVIISVVTLVFLFRQFVPPVWMLWLP